MFIANQTDLITNQSSLNTQKSDNPDQPLNHGPLNQKSINHESLKLSSPLPNNLPPEPKFSGTVKKILENRYSKPGETWKDIVYRVAHYVSQAEKADLQTYWKQKFFEQIYLQKFSPNSPAYNSGNQKQGLSACFVIGVEDNMPSILDSVYRGGMIGVCGGGYGIDFSPIRPKNFSISGCNSGASGPVSFLGMHDAMAVSVKQGGRRKVAEMANMRVSHLDILDFIDAKATPGVLENMNMSIFVDDEFMHAAEQDQLYRLYYKNVSKYESASMILNRMALRAWETGEPGILFEDRINQDNACPNLGRITATNPCVTGDTWVNTTEGKKQIFEILGKKVTLIIDGKETPTTDEGFFFTGVKPVYEIETKHGYKLKATADHKIMTNSGWKEVRHLDKEDEIFLDNNMTSRFASRRVVCPQESVYDCTVPDGHKFVANGMVVHNCSEQPLRPNEACTLGSINLDKFVSDSGFFYETEFVETIHTAIRFLDNTIDANFFPDDIIDNATKYTRPIGLGIMGLADYLIKRRVVYGSEESLKEVEYLFKLLRRESLIASARLGEEKGSFPAFRKSKFKSNYPAMRNSQQNTVAPTGSLSLIAGCSPGIEPYYSFASIRRTVSGFKDEVVLNSKYHEQVLSANRPAYFISGSEVSPENHIRVLATAQDYIDTGISKTISLPEEATVEDVKQAFKLAWELGCKGVTVFRDRNEYRQALLKEVCPIHKETLVQRGRCYACPICGWSNRCTI